MIFDKWFKSKPEKENKPEEIIPILPDYTKYVEYTDKFLTIRDREDKLTALPDDFFESYADAESLGLFAGALTAIPSSINKLTHLKLINFAEGKFRTLPDMSALHIERILFQRNNLIDLNKELHRLQSIQSLHTIKISSYKGNTFPESVIIFKNLKHLELGYELEKKIDLPGLFNIVTRMPWLETLNLEFWIKPESLPSNLADLDFLKKLSFRAYYKEDSFPSVLGLTKHVAFQENSSLEKVITGFRNFCEEKHVPDNMRQILFCLFVKNFSELKNLLSDTFGEAFRKQEKKGIVLLTKVKGLSQKKWRELLSGTSFYPAEAGDKGNLIYVTGTDTEFPVFADLLLNGKTIAFQDHLQDFMVKVQDPWLLQQENTGLNDQLLQLLASNQPDNYKVAFEIIEGGGANSTVQSLLAAVMLSHPDKNIAKAAERLYDKYGSVLYKQQCKQNSSSSLRKSGNTNRKLNAVANHPDIDGFIFRLMHHVIASNNPNIKDVIPEVFEIEGNPVENLPEVIRYFSNIKRLNFYSCSKLNLKTAIPLLVQMPGLKHLVLNGSHLTIPAIIGNLTQLETLDAGYNEFEDVSTLGNLFNLKMLNVEGCKISSFEWLSSLKNLTVLNLNNNKFNEIPPAVFQLASLSQLCIRQNKLTLMDAGLLNLTKLLHLDYSNNAITSIDYRFFAMGLETLLLRSNKIHVFDWKKIKEAGAGKVHLINLNLAGNALKEFSLGDIHFPALAVVDISNNEIVELHPSVFTNTKLKELYASKNQIADVPDSITSHGYYTKIWLQDNKITELRESFAKVQIDNCDLSNNLISKMHPAFDIAQSNKYSRLYWKIRNNPVSKEMKGINGLYGH